MGFGAPGEECDVTKLHHILHPDGVDKFIKEHDLNAKVTKGLNLALENRSEEVCAQNLLNMSSLWTQTSCCAQPFFVLAESLLAGLSDQSKDAVVCCP